MKRTSGRAKRLAAISAASLSALLVLTGCTTDDGTAQAAVDENDTGFLSQEQFDEISAELETAAAIPETPIPSEPIDASQLAGKRALIMPTASFLTDCDIISKDMVSTMQELGMEATYFQTDGTTESWVLGMQQATSQGYDLVVHLCGIDPELISTQVNEATAAGVTVVSGALFDSTVEAQTSDLVTAQTNSPYYESFRATALQAVMDHRDEPFGVLLLTSDEVASTAAMTQAAEDVYAEYCAECTVTKVNVPMADMATDMTSSTQSALTADPSISVVMPMYGGTGTTYAVSALNAVNTPGVGIYGAYGHPIVDIEHMVDDGTKLQGISRHNNALRMVTILDQSLRALTGMPTMDPNEYVDQNRLVTPENVEAFLGESNEGFGDEAVNEYRALWGLA